VVDVQPNDKPDDVLALISVDDVKVGGNEKDPVKRKAAVNKGMEALTVLKSMRDKPVDQDALAGRKLADAKGGDAKGSDAKGKDGADAKGGDAKGKDGGDAKEAEKKDVPKKASDKRKKGSPMNQSRIMCNVRCAGTCEQRGLRKTSCTCGEGQHGKWCNTNKKVKAKKKDYCAKFTEGQQDAHCADDWDDATKKDMLKYYRVGIRLCSMDRPNMIKNMKQAVATLKKIQDSDSPLSNKRMQRIISSFSKGAKENKWEIADKVAILNQTNNLIPMLKAERGTKEEVEEDEMQLAKRTDDGEEQAASGEYLPYKIGSDETAYSEVKVSPTEFNIGD